MCEQEFQILFNLLPTKSVIEFQLEHYKLINSFTFKQEKMWKQIKKKYLNSKHVFCIWNLNVRYFDFQISNCYILYSYMSTSLDLFSRRSCKSSSNVFSLKNVDQNEAPCSFTRNSDRFSHSKHFLLKSWFLKIRERVEVGYR